MTNRIEIQGNKDINTEAEFISDEYLLEDTAVGATISLYRKLQGISLVELSQLTGIDINTLMYIEQDIINPINDIKLICKCINIPFAVLILNAILTERDFEQSSTNQFAAMLQPIIHKLTKKIYLKDSDNKLDELLITTN